MSFTNNKYSKWYYSIIQRSAERTSEIICVEKHHIIPRSLGGSDNVENLARLTPREHFICHWLLSKMTSGQDKIRMMYALLSMRRENRYQQRYRTKITSRVYNQIRLFLASQNFPSKKKGRTYEEMYGAEKALEYKQKIKSKRKNQIFTKERNQKISNANTGRIRPSVSIESRLERSKRMTGQKQLASITKKRADAMRGEPKKVIKCPHCLKEGGTGAMARWHFDNCKEQ